MQVVAYSKFPAPQLVWWRRVGANILADLAGVGAKGAVINLLLTGQSLVQQAVKERIM